MKGMGYKVAVCLFFLAGIVSAEEKELKGFRKGELVVVQLYINPQAQLRSERTFQFCCCRILDITPQYLKVKRYYRSETLNDLNNPDDIKWEDKDVIVYSTELFRVGEIFGWPDGRKSIPKPGPFDLW